MRSTIPKVLHKLNGKELILHVLDKVKGIGEVFVVLGYKKKMVEKIIPSWVRTVYQRRQLGTAHAVLKLEKYLKGKKGELIVLCGDVPLIKRETIIDMLKEHRKNKNYITVLITKIKNPEGYGRIIERNGEILRIVEEKSATPEEKRIKKINAGIYVFEIENLFDFLKKIKKNPLKGEYYLTDIIEIAKKNNKKVGCFEVGDWREVVGINTREELERVEKFLKRRVN